MSPPFFAPEMRVILLDDAGVADTRPSVFPGIVQSVHVELACNDVSKATIVLANLRTDGRGVAPRPPWRFDKLDVLKPGVQVRIDARYTGGASFGNETVRLRMPQAGAWYMRRRARPNPGSWATARS